MTGSPSTSVREAGSPKPARRRAGRRLSATHILIAVVVILAFVLNLLVLQDRDSTTLVVVADRPLAAGAILDADVVRLVPVDADFEGIDGLIDESELETFEGWVVSDSVAGGATVLEASLSAPGASDGLRTMSLPVDIEHAAGGSIVSGDTVDVISVLDGRAEFVAAGIEVVAVADRATGQIGTTGSYHVVVAVDADQALDLAMALDAGSIELIRSTGAAAIAEDEGGDDG